MGTEPNRSLRSICRLVVSLAWSFALGCVLLGAAILTDPPDVFFWLDIGLASLLLSFPLLLLLALYFAWAPVLAVGTAVLCVLGQRDVQGKKWAIILRFFAGMVGFNVGFMVFRLGADDPAHPYIVNSLSPGLVTSVGAVTLFCGAGIGVLSGLGELTWAVSKIVYEPLWDFLRSDKGESLFYISGAITLTILTLWGFTGSLWAGLLFFVSSAAVVALFLFFGSLYESDSEARTKGRPMSNSDPIYQQLATLVVPVAFDEARIVADLQRIRENPSLLCVGSA